MIDRTIGLRETRTTETYAVYQSGRPKHGIYRKKELRFFVMNHLH